MIQRGSSDVGEWVAQATSPREDQYRPKGTRDALEGLETTLEDLGSAMRTLGGTRKRMGVSCAQPSPKQRGLMKLLGQTRMVGQVQEVSCGSASLVQTSETINRRSTA